MLRKWMTAFAFSLLAIEAGAQDTYPNRSVSIVVPYTAGGSSDVTARILAAELSQTLGQQFYVESRTGAGGNIASQYVANANPDGYTLLLATDGPIAINPSLFGKLPFDVTKDLTPVTLATSTAFVLLASTKFPASNLKELTALAKANPDKFSFASLGIGSEAHLAGERLNKAAGIRMTHVPYRGFGPASVDLIGGRVEILFGSITSSVALVKNGNVKALAVTSAKRHPSLPDVPTMSESGFLNFEMYVWFGLMAPAATPKQIIEKLHNAVLKGLRSKSVAERFAAQSMDIVGEGPQEFAERIAADTKMWSDLIKETGAKAQ
jgi:tripartite-type tricarboxylate transporter receptor subunit TctC